MKFLSLVIVLFGMNAQAEKFVRWTYKEDTNVDFTQIVQKIEAQTGYTLNIHDFVLDEDRDLATSHYSRHLQVQSGLPIKKMSIRIWKKDDRLIQIEALIEDPAQVKKLANKILPLLKSQKDIDALAATAFLKAAELPLTSFAKSDEWTKDDLIRSYSVNTQNGRYLIEYSYSKGKVIRTTFKPYPTEDGTYSVPAQVFPIYEEVEETHEMQTRLPVELKYIFKNIQKPSDDPYTNLNDPKWLMSKYNELLAETPYGQAQGFWSYKQVFQKINDLKAAVGYSENNLGSDAVLAGKYATIQIHPNAFDTFPGVDIPKKYSIFPTEMAKLITDGAGNVIDYLVYYMTGFYGKTFSSEMDIYNRPLIYDPNHNAATYLNAGFDEVQVYYAVTKFFESYHDKGFIDPELSERPFQAVLFDPNIEYRDNAFYWNDTINFTTYSAGSANFARDNTTIWHELGHGLMDRLMGAGGFDNGGFSEGFADFAAELVINDVTEGKPYPGMEFRRSNNSIAFNVTNEEHDDGEAYGGVLRDILLQATKTDSKGLLKVTDLTIEMMRYMRQHPNPTVMELYNHLLFVDEMGTPGVRNPGELAPIITENFMKRNFGMDPKDIVQYIVSSELGELTYSSLGSRYNPILLRLTAEQTQSYKLKLEVKDGEKTQMKYPVTIKATFKGSPLQGNVHYQGEENGSIVRTISESGGSVEIPLTVTGVCDGINTQDDGCKDYIHLQVFNAGAEKPFAKKRFYVKVNKPVK